MRTKSGHIGTEYLDPESWLLKGMKKRKHLNIDINGSTSITSRYRGVFWDTQERKWRAKIQHDGQWRHLGYFSDETAAARAWDAVARERRGDDANVNFSEEEEEEEEKME